MFTRKAEGITDDEARCTPCPPSDLSILGLVRHMAEGERIWAKWLFSGHDNVPLFCGDAHPDKDPDGDFHAPPDATLAEAVEAYRSEVADADEIYALAKLDDLLANEDREEKDSLRWIYVHLIEEYARHVGHADLIRQASTASSRTERTARRTPVRSWVAHPAHIYGASDVLLLPAYGTYRSAATVTRPRMSAAVSPLTGRTRHVIS